MRQVRNVVVISDTHAGCKLGLCPPTGCPVDEGGLYLPSRLQRVTWQWWNDFWHWVPRATNGEPYYLVHNGDALDGVHHRSTTPITHNIKDQKKLATQILKPHVNHPHVVKYYHIRGTEAHSGISGCDEEEIAEDLGATRNKDGQFALYELWLRLGDHLIHFLHHIGTTSSSAHESSAVNAELQAEFAEAARWGEKPPSVIVRSHRHRSIEIRLPWEHGYATAVVTPAWQLKTPFTYRIAGMRLAPPQIGGIVIRLDDSGNPYTKTFCRHIERDAPAS